MAKPIPEPLNDLTEKAEGSLKFLLDNLARINQLDQIVKAKLSPNLQANCRIINYRDNQLVIAADSAAWATRLRFEKPNLLSALRSDGFPALGNIEIVVSERDSRLQK